jgi:hypothetical protein
MFDAYCPTCAKRHLVFASQIRGMEYIGDDVVVSYSCWCGATSVWTVSRLAGDVEQSRPTAIPVVSLAS